MLDPFRTAAELIVALLRATKFEVGLGPVGMQMQLVSPLAKQSVDDRLKKIDLARQGLAEALQAMDDLKSVAEGNKRDLERVSRALAAAEAKKEDIAAEISALKAVATLDSSAVRRGLRMPTAIDLWRERVIAFTVGILASIAAAALWELLIKPALG